MTVSPLRSLGKKGKAKSRRYSVQTITEEDYADDIALLANTPTETESLRDHLELSQVARVPYEDRQNGVHVL